MAKINLYLGDSDVERLSRLAAAEGRSKADMIRSALAAYEKAQIALRDFALDGRGQEMDRRSQASLKSCSVGSARDPPIIAAAFLVTLATRDPVMPGSATNCRPTPS
ncbi:MAG: ribbon-helix-helix domain-containing protein [Nocardiopsaceae bacterium]|jgi:hypothetical protein|nr:ribbon-helix-helix domain-containing protein [Nocardiopsaceae bacterium]